MALNTINTIPQAKAVVAQLPTRYTHETQAVFGQGQVTGFIVRLLKKDNRGVTVGSLVLRDEEAKDFVQSVAKNQGQTQRLVKAWFAEAN